MHAYKHKKSCGTAKAAGLLLALGLSLLAAAPLSGADINVIKVMKVDQAGLTFATGSQTKFSTNVNGRTFGKQNAVTTVNGWQYTTYYDENRNVVLGRRELPDGEWELIRFTDYRITSSDAHNITSVGVCEADGTIHLAFDHHAYDLNYRVSQQGVATSPRSYTWSASLFSPVTDQLGAVGKLTSLTYPRFFNAPNGNLMLYYRFGGSGNGQGVIQEYDATTHDWKTDLGIFIGNAGLYSGTVTPSSTSRNPYLNGIFYSGDRLHA
ncbi:MAG TPA: BNR-4 repeat-containing protein, partial [Oceanipulchritudo sp.]|nr:BNR-4 repeat-containing protein [Oceanipulchritudo sp.]